MTTQRTELLKRLSKAATLQEQVSLTAEIADFDARQKVALQQERDLDWARTTVEATLTPVRTHELHTAATEWLDGVDTSGESYHKEILAKVATWYGRTSDEVKADADEFAAQARGIARREASRYGESAAEAEEAALSYLSFLRQREGASGLDQIEQTVAPDGETERPTELPADVFDNFAPPVHPINEGVVGTEGSERNPQWAEFEGGTPAPYSNLSSTSVAISHEMNLDEFRARQAAIKDVTTGDAAYPNAQQLDSLEGLGYTAPLNSPTTGVEVVSQPGYGGEQIVDKNARRQKAAAAVKQARRKVAADGDSQTSSTPGYPTPSSVGDQNSSNASDQLAKEYGLSSDQVRDAFPNPQAALDALHNQTKAASLKFTAGRSCSNCTNGNHSGTNGTPGCTGGSCACTGANCGKASGGGSGKGNAEKTGASTLDQIQQTVAPDGVTERPTPLPEEVMFPIVQDWPETSTDGLVDPDTRAAVEKVSASFVPADAKDSADFRKGYAFASKWKPGKKIVLTGSTEFEAGLYAGITDNPAAQAAWVAEHAKQAAKHPVLAKRMATHDAFTSKVAGKAKGLTVEGAYLKRAELVFEPSGNCMNCSHKIGGHTGGCSESGCNCGRTYDAANKDFPTKSAKTALTETDLNTMGPGSSPSPAGATPINGAGSPGPLAGGMDPAAAGGPAPYNGAEPMGAPVVPGAVPPVATDPASAVTHTGPPNPFANEQTVAFRQRVQASLVAARNQSL